MDTASYLDIASLLSDIQTGDTLYIMSDLMSLMKQTLKNKETFDIHLFLDSFLNKIGPDGTVLIPTFNWDFCKGIAFDYVKTPGRTGTLGNAALSHPGFRRSRHPIYSFAIWGKDKDLLCGKDPVNSFGVGTVFDYLHLQQAKALAIGLPPLYGFTFLHHVEQVVRVPYRFHKEFTAPYTDENHVTKDERYYMYVRNLDLDPVEHSEPLEQIFKELNIIRTQTFGKTNFHTIFLKPAYDIIAADILYNDCRNIYTYKGQPQKA